MVILSRRFGFLAILLSCSSGLTGCASNDQSLAYIGLAASDEPGQVRRIITNALTEPMATLIRQADTGDYEDKLAYADAKIFGREADSPEITLSSVAPLDGKDPQFPADVHDIAAVGPSERGALDAWSDRLGSNIRSCQLTCIPTIYGEVRRDISQEGQDKALLNSYIIADNEKCATGIVTGYKRKVALDALYREFYSSTGKRKILAHFLIYRFQFIMSSGGDQTGLTSCGGDILEYLALYERINPQLKTLVPEYLHRELDEKSKDPNY